MTVLNILLTIWMSLRPTAALDFKQIDYCQMPCGSEHIGCYIEDLFSSDCGEEPVLIGMDDYIELILELHNTKRNSIAGGQARNLPAAKRMGEVLWDAELAYLAQLNVKQCRLWHAECRSTQLFERPGRNGNMFRYRNDYSNEELFTARIEEWLHQSHSMTMDMVESYPLDPPIPRVSYFATAIIEENNRIGCAAVRFVDYEDRKCFLLNCLYAQPLDPGTQLYNIGEPASECQTISDTYPNLCGPQEQYFSLPMPVNVTNNVVIKPEDNSVLPKSVTPPPALIDIKPCIDSPLSFSI